MKMNVRMKSTLMGCAAIAALVSFAGLSAAQAQESDVETVVVTGTKFDTDAAPAKARLDTTEPQTIINKNYIENFVPPGSDYVTILAIVPGLTGGDINGPGLSDGGTKNTLRGFPDGNFNMTYDGIPFGDSNGPTHHNISYFPASTIGSIDVDRGPGNAGNLGANTYGGTIKLFSENLSDSMQASALGSYGSFNTTLGDLNGQTGELDAGGAGTIRAMTNLQYQHSDGALSGQDLFTHNELVKIQDQINDKWTITLFGDSSFLKENLSDNNGLTPAQVYYFGKDFALQTTNPLVPTYQRYNYTSKHTDMDYARVDGDLFGVKLDNTTYTYAYWNHTFSPASQLQNQSQILSQLAGTCATTACDSDLIASGSAVNPTGVNYATDLLGYTKENAYRMYGDILRLSKDYDFGWIDGQARVGFWWESQATHRFRYYYDLTQCSELGIDPYDLGDTATNAACGDKYTSKGKLLGTQGYSTYDEHSDWSQYEPFAEVDIKALDDRLTITPGLKYIHWERSVDAPLEAKNLTLNYNAGFTTRDLLPFLEMNYRIQPSWSMYFEFAKGIYVPDISSFENSKVTLQFPAPETTTNYQLGTVYYADNFTFDADVYYIPIHNLYITATCPAPNSGDTCYYNNGAAVYQGIEGEGTYAFDDVFGFDLKGLSVFANGALMSSKADGGLWEPGAPSWTLAGGILFQNHMWKFALIDKLVGRQYEDAANTQQYQLNSYGNLTATAGYTYEYAGIGTAELSLNVDNLLDSRHNTLLTINDSSYQTNQMNSTNQYFYQAPRSLFVSLKLHY